MTWAPLFVMDGVNISSLNTVLHGPNSNNGNRQMWGEYKHSKYCLTWVSLVELGSEC